MFAIRLLLKVALVVVALAVVLALITGPTTNKKQAESAAGAQVSAEGKSKPSGKSRSGEAPAPSLIAAAGSAKDALTELGQAILSIRR